MQNLPKHSSRSKRGAIEHISKGRPKNRLTNKEIQTSNQVRIISKLQCKHGNAVIKDFLLAHIQVATSKQGGTTQSLTNYLTSSKLHE